MISYINMHIPYFLCLAAAAPPPYMGFLVVSRTASSYSRLTPTIRILWNHSTSKPILT